MPSVSIKKYTFVCIFKVWKCFIRNCAKKFFQKTLKPTEEIHVTFQIPICDFNETFSNSY